MDEKSQRADRNREVFPGQKPSDQDLNERGKRNKERLANQQREEARVRFKHDGDPDQH